MIFLFGLVTVALVLLSLFLILLVLVQLPKKDAGTGIAFGGAAADALFGAGSGNVLTKVTKYSTIAFFVLVLLLSYVHDHMNGVSDAADFSKRVAQQAQAQAAATPPPVAAPARPVVVPSTNSIQLLSTPTPAAPAPVPGNKN